MIKVNPDMSNVTLSRLTDTLLVEEDKHGIHVTLNCESMKKEIIKQLLGLRMIHGIKSVRRTELHELASKAHGLLKTDSGWSIHSIETPFNELVAEGVIERIKYTLPKKATYIRLTSKFANEHIKN
jgi:hypothetical protein